MLLIHPAMQLVGILLAIVTFLTGLQRFRSLHLHRRTKFPWRLHVLLGKISLMMLMAGMGLGLGMARYHWGQNLMTMGHGKTGLVILPFLLFGLVSGVTLDGKVKERQVLRVLHGVSNTILLLLLLNQARSGLRVYMTFVSGL